MKSVLTVLAAAVAALSLTTGTAHAAGNPYGPGQVCGSGFGVIDQFDVKGPKGGVMGTSYLLYDAGSKRNCAVTLKRRAVGKASYTTVSLKAAGAKAAWHVDFGDFKYYAGPVYVKAPGRCVRFGATMKDLAGREGGWISPCGHCG